MAESPLDEFAPYPRHAKDVTASSLIKHYAAFGQMHNRVADEFIAEDQTQYRTSLGHVVSSFTTVYLLAEIRFRLGVETANDVARELWSVWQDGELPSWLRDWADEEGLDHNKIAGAADEVVKNIRAKSVLLAHEMHPGQTEIPPA